MGTALYAPSVALEAGNISHCTLGLIYDTPERAIMGRIINPYSAGIDFNCQNLMSVDVDPRTARVHLIIFNGRRPLTYIYDDFRMIKTLFYEFYKNNSAL